MTKGAAVMELAKIDPRIAVFAISAICIVALGGMVLDYDIDLSVLGCEVRLSRQVVGGGKTSHAIQSG